MGQSTLLPFFSFYGGKWRDTPRNYPPPAWGTVVEPFAGSAGYSVRYASSGVKLCEIDPVIFGVWEYLIRVKSSEVLNLPDVEPQGSVDCLDIPQEAKSLIGFWLNKGTATPRKRPSKWMRGGSRPGSFWGPSIRHRIANQVDQIRHWQVFNCSYEDCPVRGSATWFIDPPYTEAGKHYKFGSAGIDYDKLASWCRSRHGQVIVCENDGADWLPFRFLASVKATRAGGRSRESIWSGVEPILPPGWDRS